MSPPLRLARFTDGAAFLEAAGPFLLEREAEHNLTLGLAAAIRDRPGRFTEAPYLGAVNDATGRVVMTALRTPPHNLVLSVVADPSAVGLIAAGVADAGHDLPGVLGPPGVAEAFARAWCEPRRLAWKVVHAERIFQLAAVVPPSRPSSGRYRPATAADHDTLVDWLVAFEREALPEMPHTTREEFADAVTTALAGGGYRTFYLWEDGDPVSLAGASGATPNGIRIGPVYTPPELRRRGYAGSLVAAVSQAQLDAGRRFCFLYTDLANPTSNKIYQEVGYRPVADANQLRFLSREA